jgi:hypothetical protein
LQWVKKHRIRIHTTKINDVHHFTIREYFQFKLVNYINEPDLLHDFLVKKGVVEPEQHHFGAAGAVVRYGSILNAQHRRIIIY